MDVLFVKGTVLDVSRGEIVDATEADGRQVRVLVAKDEDEWNLLAHVRGWCHNGAHCALCTASAREQQARLSLERVISG